jgi:ParB family transcriptional regulator, chromosome partitioning protein
LPTKPPRPQPRKPKQPSLRDRLSRNSLFRTSADLPRVVELDIDALAPNPEQPRTRLDPAALDELRQSIERHGLLQPLLARKAAGGGEGSYELVAGHRRLEALRTLGRNTVPAILVSGDPGELALVENLQRQDLDPFEEAAAVARLMERHDYTQGEVGALLGRRQNTVSALLALNQLPPEICEDYMRQTNSVSRSLLIELAQINDSEQQLRLWQIVKSGGLTIRDMRLQRRMGTAAEGDTQPKAAAVRKPKTVLSAASRLVADLRSLPPAAYQDATLVARLRELHDMIARMLEALRT